MISRGNKNKWALFLCLLAGVVIGSMIGHFLGSFEYLKWLTFGETFGIDQPLTLNLGVIILKFALMVKINVAGIIGIVISIFAYLKL